MESLVHKMVREDTPPHPIIVSIREVCARMNAAQSRFEQETDPDLVEAAIYELQSLRAQYRYLLRIAREEGVVCREKVHLWNE